VLGQWGESEGKERKVRKKKEGRDEEKGGEKNWGRERKIEQ
jgi:hypothetical protein